MYTLVYIRTSKKLPNVGCDCAQSDLAVRNKFLRDPEAVRLMVGVSLHGGDWLTMEEERMTTADGASSTSDAVRLETKLCEEFYHYSTRTM
eukprot:scaffold30523_cov30-Prasinocladus_malaysianus.AAC.1